jgi:aminopeptidase 2
LIDRTLKLALSGEVKDQDIYLPLGNLRTHTTGIEALWKWLQSNWSEIERRLPAGLSMLGSVVQVCTSSFTKQGQIESVQRFFSQRSTKGFDQGLAQSLDSIRAKASWLDRDRDDVSAWLKANGYIGKGGKL